MQITILREPGHSGHVTRDGDALAPAAEGFSRLAESRAFAPPATAAILPVRIAEVDL